MNGRVKYSVGILSLICIILLISPACTAGLGSLALKKKDIQPKETSASQYWALLFAVGEYENAPNQTRPSMLEACDNLYNALLESPQYWQASNIHVQKAGQCYLQNLIKEFLWLRKSAKREDYVFVYLTTHGYYLTKQDNSSWDLFPKEELDGKDEFLFMYNGYSTNYGIIWDDLLNFFLSIIRCQGLCLVVDSCYSGGFNDRPVSITNQRRYTAMSSQENELSYGSDFSDFFIAGLQDGLADTNIWILGTTGNNDGIVSAQESFRFAQTWVEFFGPQTPTEADLFGAEFPLAHT
jgi:hypothetical protein